MKGARILQVPVSSGSRATGRRKGVTTAGFPAAGTTRLTKEATGTTRTMTTNEKAGGCMKAIGITRTTIAIITRTTTSMSATNPSNEKTVLRNSFPEDRFIE